MVLPLLVRARPRLKKRPALAVCRHHSGVVHEKPDHAGDAETVERIRQLVKSYHDAYAAERVAAGAGAGAAAGAAARRVDGHLRAMIADEQRYRCALCGSLFLGGYHVDHKRPQFQGGSSERSNLWALCIICHGRKTALEQSMRVEAARNTEWGQCAVARIVGAVARIVGAAVRRGTRRTSLMMILQ